MTEDMQQFGHRDSAYASTSQIWQCGHMDSCKSGPDENGKCPASQEGCVPVRSVKAVKRRYAQWIMGAILACLVVFFAGQKSIHYLSPVPLSVNHAEVASCQDCHSASALKKTNWIQKAVHLNSNNDDKKCLSCHKYGDNAFLPHSTAAINLSTKPEKSAQDVQKSSDWQVNLASSLHAFQTQDSDNTSCAQCHREHKGKFVPLDAFDPKQCQICHTVKFDDLESEHPAYSNFPHENPTRIKFDHVSHLEKHFFEDDYFDIAPEGCKQCHDTDQSGEWMLSKSFETTCNDCHLGEILGDARANSKGVAVLSIPEIDTEILVEAGYNIGQWPQWADGEVVPIMRLLLPKSLQKSAALQNKSLDLYDLSEATPDQLRSVSELAWGIKELYYDIQMGGTQLMNQRIAKALGDDIDQPTLNRLVASLPKDTLVNNQKEWFPELIEEITQYKAGKIKVFDPSSIKIIAPAKGTEILNITEPQDIVTAGGNQISFDDDSIGGGILGDEEDILLDDNNIGDDIIDDDEDILLGDDSISLDDESITLDDQAETIDGEEDDILLDEEDTGDIILAEDDDILLDGDDILIEDDEIVTTQLQDDDVVKGTVDMVVANDNEAWAQTGGWYRDGSNIRYRPIDHADPFLRSWLDVSSKQSNPQEILLFKALSKEKSVGNCTKCHSVETTTIISQAPIIAPEPLPEQSLNGENAQYQVNWKSFRPGNVVVDFNRFSHTAHFSLMTDDGCTSCHLLNEDAKPPTDIQAADIQVASFVDMDKETCTECHRQGRAPDNCLTCHNYHVEPRVKLIEQISDLLRGDKDNE